MKKRILSVFLVISIVFSLFPITALAVSSTQIGFAEPISTYTTVPTGYTGIFNASDFENINWRSANDKYILMADIDMSSLTHAKP